jgi:predicted N-formylglutamate amidohydrolase
MALLASDEPSPAVPFQSAGQAPAFLCCDHAGRAIPRALGDLGVTEEELGRHIGWDIGALDVATRLAAMLDAPGVAAPYSRLVIDCNRRLGHVGSIPAVSDGVTVPGNQNLSDAQKAARAEAIWRPYHEALAAGLAKQRARHANAVLISVHSFTPEMAGKARPWQIGVVWNRDARLAEPVLATLSAHADLCVGDNLPYSGRDGFGFTVPNHAGSGGHPHIMFEIRQNEIADATGAQRYATLICEALRPILPAYAG